MDPHTGKPVDAVPQVTMLAASATLADDWSKAMVVLGPDGIKLLPPGVETTIISTADQQPRIYESAGFARYLDRDVPSSSKRASN